MKILIAEDDPISRRVLELNLVEWGYEVMVASDGAEAWEIIQQPESPNLIISDWMMPRMDGPESTEPATRNSNSDHYVVIASDDNGTKRFAEEHTKIPTGNIACRQWKPKARGF
jgi:CheY-like chemotaxis protein